MDQVLADRVRTALTVPQSADKLRDLVASVRAEIATLGRAETAAHAKAIDPLASIAEVSEARSRYTDLKLDQERAAAALKRLEEAYAAAMAAEAEERQRQAGEAARQARDKAAAHLAAVYPRAAMEIIEAIEAVEAADALGFGGGTEQKAFGHLLNGGNDDVWPLRQVLQLPRRLGMTKSISRHGIRVASAR